MFKKILPFILLFAINLFAFQSRFLPYDININCSQILHKTTLDICYSCKFKTPKMVVYKVDGNLIDSKNLSRKHLYFRPDYQLPTRCRSYPKDYSRTGFDRGHLAPNAVFDYNRRVQKETFLMSNIAPQKPKLNRRLWNKIERFVRMQARRYGNVRVITGVCGSMGHIKHGVNIPSYWYKIIFRPDGKVISFLAPNINRGMTRARAKEFLTDVGTIEKTCGFEIKKQ